MAALIRKNAEDLVMALCGKGFERAYNPNCLPKRRGRPKHHSNPCRAILQRAKFREATLSCKRLGF